MRAREPSPTHRRREGRKPEESDIARPSIDQLIADHGAHVMNLLRGILPGGTDAEDAWQETWFSVWRNRRALRDDASAWGYVRKTAVRKALDRRRAAERRIRVESLSTEPPAPLESKAAALDLEVLPPRERAILILRFWEGLSLQEIAELVEVPLGTVKSRLFRARTRLQKALEAVDHEESCHDL